MRFLCQVRFSSLIVDFFICTLDSRVAPIWGSLHVAGAEHQKKRFCDNIVLNHFSLMTNVPQQVSSSPFLSESEINYLCWECCIYF